MKLSAFRIGKHFTMRLSRTASLLLLLAVASSSPTVPHVASSSPAAVVPFEPVVIDSSFSGDDKAVADIDMDGKPDVIGGDQHRQFDQFAALVETNFSHFVDAIHHRLRWNTQFYHRNAGRRHGQ